MDPPGQVTEAHWNEEAKAILGGLIFAALDTGGRPSVFWTGKKAAVNAADAVSLAAQQAYSTVTP